MAQALAHFAGANTLSSSRPNPIGTDHVQATARGHTLLVRNSLDDRAIESRVVDNLIGRHVDGLILSTVLPATDSRLSPTAARRPC